MQTSDKPCNGIGKAKGFDGCGDISPLRKNGLCPKCLYRWTKETEEGKAWFEKQNAFTLKRHERARKKEQREERLEFREKNKSIQRLITEARVPFQKWIRYRDVNKACISCNQIDTDIWDAGHFFKAELYSGLIFDERNCNKQCRKCNTYLGGNESGYRVGLVARYGEEFVAELEESANRLRAYKYERQELRDIKKKYLEKLKKIGV